MADTTTTNLVLTKPEVTAAVFKENSEKLGPLLSVFGLDARSYRRNFGVVTKEDLDLIEYGPHEREILEDTGISIE